MKQRLLFAVFLVSFSSAANTPRATYTVVANLESDATYIYHFEQKRFSKNPHSKADMALTQTKDEKTAFDKACEVAKRVGNAVHVAKWNPPTGTGSAHFTNSCEGTACCK